MLADNFVDIQKRNDAMWFRNLPPRVLARLTEAVSDVTVSLSLFPATCFLILSVHTETEFYRAHH
jgi:mediator of RNA polymerase II transcription subunit 12